MGSHFKLPRFIVIKSQRNNKYLRHVNEIGTFHRYLQFSGTDFLSPHVKFEVEPSTGDDQLVHLKCCYNNKYWVAHEQDRWILAEANDKEEDQSKRSCTLFKPEFLSTGRVALYHVRYKTNVTFADGRPFNLYAGVISKNGDYLDYIDWETLPILPKFIALKSNSNLFLNATQVHEKGRFADYRLINPLGTLLADQFFEKLPDGPFYLRFNCDDMGIQTVGNQVFYNRDGTVRIKNIYTGGFWKLSPSWIWPYASENDYSSGTSFKVEKVGHNKIALKNLGNDRYCMSLTTEGKHDCLNAGSNTIPTTAEFEVFELVKKREIYNVDYHFEDAKVYQKEIITKTAMSDKNHSDKSIITSTLEFTYTSTDTKTWSTTISTKEGIEVQITAGIPEYVGGTFKLSREVTETYEKGTSSTVTKELKTKKEVPVQPLCATKGNLVVTQAICDIPYSYSKRDTLTDGNIDTSDDMDDGVYTTIHTEIDFDYEDVLPTKS